jgi:hypothetical protein
MELLEETLVPSSLLSELLRVLKGLTVFLICGEVLNFDPSCVEERGLMKGEVQRSTRAILKHQKRTRERPFVCPLPSIEYAVINPVLLACFLVPPSRRRQKPLV